VPIINILITIGLICSPFLCYSQKTDTISIYFTLGKSNLTDDTKHLLDSLAYHDVLIASENYGIIGYADYLGSDAENNKLSTKRAEHIAAYLTGLGMANITTVSGKGEIDKPENDVGYAEDRRVDIVSGYKAPPPKKVMRPIDISGLKVGETFELSEIFFEPSKSELLEQSMTSVNLLYDLMSNVPGLEIQIEGHVHCNSSDFKKETSSELSKKLTKLIYELSLNRSLSIYDYLVSRGIEKERMKYVGLGCQGIKEHPENNMRVEIRILKK